MMAAMRPIVRQAAISCYINNRTQDAAGEAASPFNDHDGCVGL